MSRPAFLFDVGKCTGCQACELACMIENELDGWSWRQVTTFNEARHPGVPVFHLSLACNHCEDAPCQRHCPALAYDRDPATGIVRLDAEKCIGCRYCGWACPFDAPKFDDDGGVMTKCTFCEHRQADGGRPACVEQCPTGALGFGTLDRLPGDSRMTGLPPADCGPSIRFVAAPSLAATPVVSRHHPRTASKIELRREWPLAAFTLIAASTAALYAATTLGGRDGHPAVFPLLAALGLGISTLHLGRPLRAWRAALNLRRSWLSREVVLFGSFVASGTAQLLVAPQSGGWPGVWAGANVVLGAAALFAMDRVYDLVRLDPARPVHSADVLLTGLLGTALLVPSLPAALAVATVKLVLYLARKARQARGARRPGWSFVRVGVGFGGALVAGLLDPERWASWALVATAIGEIVDRCELYTELEVASPRRQMDLELRRRLEET